MRRLSASIAGPRPVTLLIVVGQSEHLHDMTALFQAVVDRARDALVIAYGGQARLLASVMEYLDEGGHWTGLSFRSGGPGWMRSELQALAPHGYPVRDLDPEDIVKSMAARPLVGFWCSLFGTIVGEARSDVRVFRLWSLVETIAKRVIALETPVLDGAGTSLELAPGKSATTKEARRRVFLLLHQAQEALELPHDAAVCHPDHDLWHEVEVWYGIRNAVAHDGAWLPPPHHAQNVDRQRRVFDAAMHAARPGGQLEEGIDRYRNHLQANVEVVLRAALDGAFDTALARSASDVDE